MVLKKPAILDRLERRRTGNVVRIHEIDIPMPTLDPKELLGSCLVPVYRQGIVRIGDKGASVTSADGQVGQVVIGHMAGFNGGQALIIRETAMALDEMRLQIETLDKGLRASLEISQELAKQAQVGQDASTCKRLKALEDGLQELREALFPEMPLDGAEKPDVH